VNNHIHTIIFITILHQKRLDHNLAKNEWFKILNVSAGYERALSKSWSIQAEPFIKVPLSGVGFGDMDISSYGILVGIKYKPVFSKTKQPCGKIP
jgi:hypothetical protein